jgi:hypothetical protein
MSELWSVLAGGFIGLLGVVIGTWFTAYLSIEQQKRQSRIQLVLELFSEFQSREMLESRTEAGDTMKNHATAMSQGLAKLRQVVAEDEWLHISRVVHFFETFAIFYTTDNLSRDLARSTLGRYFTSWYEPRIKPLANASLQNEDHWYAWAVSMNSLAKALNLS